MMSGCVRLRLMKRFLRNDITRERKVHEVVRRPDRPLDEARLARRPARARVERIAEVRVDGVGEHKSSDH
jgi:hypothetical protein